MNINNVITLSIWNLYFLKSLLYKWWIVVTKHSLITDTNLYVQCSSLFKHFLFQRYIITGIIFIVCYILWLQIWFYRQWSCILKLMFLCFYFYLKTINPKWVIPLTQIIETNWFQVPKIWYKASNSGNW